MPATIAADDLETAWLAAKRVESRPYSADHEVLLTAVDLVGALARDVDLQAGVRDADDHVVVQRKGQPHRVEARSEVG